MVTIEWLELVYMYRCTSVHVVVVSVQTLDAVTLVMMLNVLTSQQTRDIHPMLHQCWASVVDGEPTLVQHWVRVSCLLLWNCGHCRLFNFYYVSKCGIHVHTWVSFVIFISVTLHSVTEMKIATLTIQTHDIVILSFISIISDLLYNLELDCNLQCYCILLKLAHMFKTTYITLYSLSICFWGQILIPALSVH